MKHWTGVQRGFAVKSYNLNGQCEEAARREFCRYFQLRRHDPVLSSHAIKTWVRNLEETDSALKKKPPGLQIQEKKWTMNRTTVSLARTKSYLCYVLHSRREKLLWTLTKVYCLIIQMQNKTVLLKMGCCRSGIVRPVLPARAKVLSCILSGPRQIPGCHQKQIYPFQNTLMHSGCNETETLGHVLGFCRKTELLRNNRHHKARTGIVDVLKRRGWEVYEEIHCVSSLDSNRRADIVAIHRTQSKGIILDPTIRFERDALQAQHVDEETKSIYETYIPYLSEKNNLPTNEQFKMSTLCLKTGRSSSSQRDANMLGLHAHQISTN
ncbi:hypothetical protein ANN_27030 [Periplaneta americana]|uniref:DUF4817 domain-containing protein n=1 Tax=Periplaneta americana TaxID=6978 RepID=A0ABQ8RX22_PERAM|nr:hypothetical protein ANN_27030 [Periplaneta americana]